MQCGTALWPCVGCQGRPGLTPGPGIIEIVSRVKGLKISNKESVWNRLRGSSMTEGPGYLVQA